MKAILSRDVKIDEIKILGLNPDKNLFPAGMMVNYITTQNIKIKGKIISKSIIELKVRLAIPTDSIIFPKSHYIST